MKILHGLFLGLLFVSLAGIPCQAGDAIRRTVEFLIERGEFVRAESLIVNLERQGTEIEDVRELRKRLERRKAGLPMEKESRPRNQKNMEVRPEPVVAENPAPTVSSGTTRYAETLLARGLRADAIERLRTAASTDPHARLLLGKIYHQDGRHSEAFEELRQALEMVNDAAGAFNAGMAAFECGREDDGRKYLDLAIRWDPNSPAPCLVLGNRARSSGKFVEAREYYLEALKRAPQMVEAHLAMADTMYLQGDEQESARTYAWILEQFPKVADTCYLGLARILLKHDRADDALKMIRQAEGVAPGNSQIFEMRAALEEGRNHLKEALQDWRQAMKLRPESRNIRRRIVELLVKLRDMSGAREEIHRALRDDPDYGRYHYLLGVIHTDARDWDLAEKHLRKALKDREQELDAIVALGIMREQQGRRKEAGNFYSAGLERATAVGNARMTELLRRRVDALGGTRWQGKHRERQSTEVKSPGAQPESR